MPDYAGQGRKNPDDAVVRGLRGSERRAKKGSLAKKGPTTLGKQPRKFSVKSTGELKDGIIQWELSPVAESTFDLDIQEFVHDVDSVAESLFLFLRFLIQFRLQLFNPLGQIPAAADRFLSDISLVGFK